jgi:WD40 repeat protein
MTPRDDALRIDKEHPWPWLDAFPESAREFFNGRDEAAQQLLRCVLAAPATVLFGKSGLGKTSLLQAGLSPLLREEQLLPVLVRLTHRDAVYQSGLLSSRLMAKLDEEARTYGLSRDGPLLPHDAASAPFTDGTIPTVISASTRLWELLHDRETHWLDAQGGEWTPVFILDQFEEVFTLMRDAEQQQRLFSELGNLIQNRTPADVAERRKAHETLRHRLDPERLGARFVLSLREDYLPDLEIHADRIPRLGPNRYRLLPMSHADALLAIDKTGGELVEATDAERIVQFLDQQNQQPADAGRPRAQRLERIEPALLSLVCAGLNQHRIDQKAAQLDTRSLDQLGGQLLEQFYDRVLLALPGQRRETAARFVESELITLDGTRRPFPEVSLPNVGLTADDLATLKDKRLLRTENTENGAFVELVHDRLAQVALQRAQRHAEVAAQAAEAQQRQRKRDLLTGIGLIVLVVALVGAAAFLWQWRKTEAALIRAEMAVRDATAQRVLSDANDFFGGINRPSTGPQNLLMTLAGHRIAQLSRQPFAQNAGYAALQREVQRSGSLIWLQETSADISCIAFSPDGSRVVSHTADGMSQLWDAQSGLLLGQPRDSYSAQHLAIGLDCSQTYSRGTDGMLQLSDAHSRAPIGHPLNLEGRPAAVSADGSRVVIVDDIRRTLTLADVSTGKSIGKILQLPGHFGSFGSADFSPDSRVLASSSPDFALHLWDARSGKKIGKPLRGHSSYVASIAFSSDGSRIVSGSIDGSIRLWDARSGATVGQPLHGNSSPVTYLAFSPDGSRVASGTWDGILRLWDARSGATVGQPLHGDSSPVTYLAFSPDGSRVASGTRDGILRLWDARPDSSSGRCLCGHSDAVTSVAFSPDGSRIVSGSDDKTLRLWDVSSGTPIGQPLRGHSDIVSSVAFSPDGSRIVSGSGDKTLRLWDARTGAPAGQPLQGHLHGVSSVAFSPNSFHIVSSGDSSRLLLWNLRSGTPRAKLFEDPYGAQSVAFSPDGSQAVSGDGEGKLQLWDTVTGRPIGPPMLGHSDIVHSVAFSPDGSRIVSGSQDGTLRLWDPRSGTFIGEPLRAHSSTVFSVAFSPDGSRIVSGSADATLRLWDARSGTPIGQPLQGSSDPVYAVAFSPDGSRVVSGGYDKTVRLWRVLDSWTEMLCAKLPRNMSRKEWSQWVSSDIDYIEQCPGKPIPSDRPTRRAEARTAPAAQASGNFD